MPHYNTHIARCAALAVVTAATLFPCTGCIGLRIRDRMRANEGAFSDAPALPKADFGREKAPMKSTGTDRRSREIEASLGVGE